MRNLFRIFDPVTFLFKINWIAALLGLIFIPGKFWGVPSPILKSLNLIVNFVGREFKAVFGDRRVPGVYFIRVSLFIFIFFNNFLGLTPYIFTRSRHGRFTLRIAIPLWVGHIRYSAVKQPNLIWAHLVPIGTPRLLVRFMVLVEALRRVIRPLTLAIRLIANIVAGHLLLTLLGSLGYGLACYVLPLFFLGILLLIVLEIAVAVIQRYVFRVLSRLYLQEVNRTKLRVI